MPIIANMGLFWNRNVVRWRGNRRTGPAQLFGKRAVAKRKGDVDFWEQVGIYALYTESYSLVYVGQAGIGNKGRLGPRLKEHTKDDLAGRWDLFSWFGLRAVKADNTLGKQFKIKMTKWRDLANIVEGTLIEVAEPIMNNQKGRFGKAVERFLQVPDEELAADMRKSIATLVKSVGQLEKQVKKLS